MSVISATMKRSLSTILRELNRNTIAKYKVYLPDTSDETERQRRTKGKGRFKRSTTTTIEDVKQGLEQYHSPEQIAGRMKQEGKLTVSYETIYQMIDLCKPPRTCDVEAVSETETETEETERREAETRRNP